MFDEESPEREKVDSREDRLNSLIEQLQDPKVLPLYDETAATFNDLAVKRPPRLKPGQSAWDHMDIVKLHLKAESADLTTAKLRKKLQDFLFEKRIFEVLTDTYVQSLGEYLGARSEGMDSLDKKTTILEVAAGSGKLGYHLNKYFESAHLDRHITTTDSQKDGLSVGLSVENSDYKAALAKYAGDGPIIVLCSWMPRGFDMTEEFQRYGVNEYILIGDVDATGTEYTWGTAQEEQRETNYERTILTDIRKYQMPSTLLSDRNAKNTCSVVSFRRK